MSFTINVLNQKGETTSAVIDEQPDECPICHKGIDPQRLDAVIKDTFGGHKVQVVYKCPRLDCFSLFIATYSTSPNSSTGLTRLRRTDPVEPVPRQFDDLISKLSPSFCEIYNQAAAAEQIGLNQVCGIGYRKAIEFLIKDYAIYNDPSNTDEIKKTFLGQCIKNYVDDPRVKECAELATWLGNDETHYVRKWIDQDVTDLKMLIEMTLNWIELVRRTEEYKKKMKPNTQPTASTP